MEKQRAENKRDLSQSKSLSRRQFLAGVAGAGAAFGLTSCITEEKANAANIENKHVKCCGKNIYWGDIHNHNDVGYAKGSLERSYEIARDSLDFFCCTAQTQWHDMPQMPQNKHMKWVNGFKAAKDSWPTMLQFAERYNEPGKFVPFLGYEWHSSGFGDVCIMFPGAEAELVYINDIKELQKYAADHDAVLIPHHPAYKQGRRGQNWDVLDTKVSPVVEIFSEHGNAESDRSPGRYIRHSMGGRVTKNTLQWLWEQGVKVGVVASTDDHFGYPGAYGEGLAAVYADSLDRKSIMEAIKARRTYGVSADRIELDFRLNGRFMGEEIPHTPTRKINVKVKGKDVVERVEILRNNQVIYRDYPIDRPIRSRSWDRPVLCRVEFGWGPWAALNMARICDWKFDLRISGGKVISATPCFQSGPYDEQRRNKVTMLNNKHYQVSSYTSRKQAFAEMANNSVILEIQGSPQTKLTMEIAQPTKLSITKSLAELAELSHIDFTGPFTSESLLLHRPVFADNYETEFEFTDKSNSGKTDWYYARVTQTNGSLAWSSPIWVEQG